MQLRIASLLFSASTGLAVASCSAATPSPGVSDYPLSAVISEYRKACGAFATREEAQDAVESADWKAVDAYKSPLANSLRHAEEMMQPMLGRAGGELKPTLVYTKEIAGQRVWVSLTDSSFRNTRIVGCRLFDLGEATTFTKAELEKVVGRPAALEQQLGSLTATVWQPGFNPSAMSFEIWQIPPGSPQAVEQKFDGIMLRTDKMETVKK